MHHQDPSTVRPGHFWAIDPPAYARPHDDRGTWIAARNRPGDEEGKPWAVSRADRHGHSRATDEEMDGQLLYPINLNASAELASAELAIEALDADLATAQAAANALPSLPVTRADLEEVIHAWADGPGDADDLVDSVWRLIDPQQARIEQLALDYYRTAFPTPYGATHPTDADLAPFRRLAAATPTGGMP